MIKNLFNGFVMALADSVPGVSGGSIAFILGFYDLFINSLNDLFFGKKEEKINAIKYLMKLGIGWIIGMGLAVCILTSLFESHIYGVSSLFLGFVLFSIPLIIKDEFNSLKNYKNIVFMLIGIALVVLLTYLNKTSVVSNTLDLSFINFKLVATLLISGMLAISAMVLPGISGSTILLIFGVYMPIISSVKEMLKFNFKYLPALIIFGIGIILGIFLIIKAVKKALEKYRSATMYSIIGLMIGSLYAICMGPTTLKVPVKPLSFSSFNILTFFVGIIIALALEIIKFYFNKTRKNTSKN